VSAVKVVSSECSQEGQSVQWIWCAVEHTEMRTSILQYLPTRGHKWECLARHGNTWHFVAIHGITFQWNTACMHSYEGNASHLLRNSVVYNQTHVVDLLL